MSDTLTVDSLRYDAFVSYSHAQDKPLASALQAAVQRLGKPWYRRRALRVFRDDTSLNATPHLWPSIVTALQQSRFLILMASPEAAASTWVGQEIEWWLAHKGVDTLLIGLTGGDLVWDMAEGDFAGSEASPLPPALKARFVDEPRWTDLRRYRTDASPKDDSFLALAADFASTIRGIPKDDLLSQEVRQHRRALRLAGASVGVFFVLLCLAAWQWWEAETQRSRAERTIDAATQTVNQLIVDIARRFRLGGQFSVVKDIVDKLSVLQGRLLETGGATPQLQYGQAMALNELYSSFIDDGDTAGAFTSVNKARGIFQTLLQSDPDNLDYLKGLLFSNDAAAQLLFADGKLSASLNAFDSSTEIVKRLWQANPKDTELVAMMSMLQGQSAIILQRQGRNDEALQALENSMKLNGGHDYAGASKLKLNGDILRAKGDFAGAMAKYEDASALNKQYLDEQPANGLFRNFPMMVDEAEGETLIAQGQLPEALAVFERVKKDAIKMPIADGTNLFFAEQIAISDLDIGDILLAQKDPEGSLKALNEAATYIGMSLKHDPTSVSAQSLLSEIKRRIGDALAAKGDRESALAAYGESLKIRRSLLAIDISDVGWQTELASTLQGLASVDQNRNTDLHEALDILRKLDSSATLPREEQHRVPEIEAALASPPER